MGLIFFAFFEKFFVPILTSGGLAAVSSSFFAALYSAFGRYDVVHIHAEGRASSGGAASAMMKYFVEDRSQNSYFFPLAEMASEAKM